MLFWIQLDKYRIIHLCCYLVNPLERRDDHYFGYGHGVISCISISLNFNPNTKKLHPNAADARLPPKHAKTNEAQFLSPPQTKNNVPTDNLFPSIKRWSKTDFRNRRKISGYGVVVEKSLFLTDWFDDKGNLSETVMIEGVVIYVPNKEYTNWSIHW